MRITSSRAARPGASRRFFRPSAAVAAAGVVVSGNAFAGTITQNSLISQNTPDYVLWEGEHFHTAVSPDNDNWKINFNAAGASGNRTVQAPNNNDTNGTRDAFLTYRIQFSAPSDGSNYHLYAFRYNGNGDSIFVPPDFNQNPYQTPDLGNVNRWNALTADAWNNLSTSTDAPPGGYFATGARNYAVTAAQAQPGNVLEFRFEAREQNAEFDRFLLHKNPNLTDFSGLLNSPTTVANPVPVPPPPVPSWQVLRQNAAGVTGGGLDDGLIDNMTEGQYVLANGGAPEATGEPEVMNYSGGNFPGSNGQSGDVTNDFAIRARGIVDVLNGTTQSNVQLTVNSDDGFALKVNGVEVGRFEDPRAPGDTNMPGLTLNDGDVLELDFFERGGGEVLALFRTDGGLRELVGSQASGIDILIPEPASLSVFGIGTLGLLARRRRRA